MIDLTSYSSVKSCMLVAIDKDGTYGSTLTFTDNDIAITDGGVTYTPLGKLLGMSQTQSELRPSSNEISLTISGIPNSELTNAMAYEYKGAPIQISRAFFESGTTTLISDASNPMVRFKGVITNYSLNEEFSFSDMQSTNTIVLTCASYVDFLSNKIAGRKTNPESQKKFYASDVSMDRVPTLETQEYNFGAET